MKKISVLVLLVAILFVGCEGSAVSTNPIGSLGSNTSGPDAQITITGYSLLGGLAYVEYDIENVDATDVIASWDVTFTLTTSIGGTVVIPDSENGPIAPGDITPEVARLVGTLVPGTVVSISIDPFTTTP